MRELAVIAFVTAGMFGCHSVRDLGKACADGNCTRAPSTASDRVPCLVSGQVSEVLLESDRKRTECLALDPLLGSDGLLDCTLQWRLPGADACAELELQSLRPPPSNGGSRCDVPQVLAKDGKPESAAARGFYYAGTASCEGGLGRIALTEGLEAPQDAITVLNCMHALASVEDAAPALNLPDDTVAVRVSSCATPQSASSDRVGDTCLPSVVPEGGFDKAEAYVQTGLDECATGACLVYHLEGDPRDPRDACEQEPSGTLDAGDNACASDDEIEDRVYCTCRCHDGTDAGAGAGCECPDGFACIELLTSPAEGFEGGYCVKLGDRSSSISIVTANNP